MNKKLLGIKIYTWLGEFGVSLCVLMYLNIYQILTHRNHIFFLGWFTLSCFIIITGLYQQRKIKSEVVE